jgi:cytochrome c oxidase subunit 2
VGSNAGSLGARHVPVRRAVVVSLVGLALLVASGCSTAQVDELKRGGMPEPVTDRADHALGLWQGAWSAAIFVGLVVCGLIVWSVIAYRRRDDSIPPQTRYHLPIEMLYTVVPFVVIAVLFYFTVQDQNAILDVDPDDPPQHSIEVVGQQWAWTFNYESEDEIGSNVWETGNPDRLPTLYLPVGEKVGVTINSPDVIHSFFVPAFLFKMDVMPGKENYFEFTATKEGEFAGKCAELCGVFHSRMLFSVHVVSPEDYEAHLEELEAKGQTGKATGGKAAKTQEGLVQESGETQ